MFTPDQEGVPRGCLLRVIYVSPSPTPPLEATAVTLFGLTPPPTRDPCPEVARRLGKREHFCPRSHCSAG